MLKGDDTLILCAHNRECLFGDVVNSEMQLSAIGTIVLEEWLRSPEIRAEIELDEWIIMPNHLHGIVVIVGAHGGAPNAPDTPGGGHDTPNRADSRPPLRRQPRSLGSFIAGFKSAVTTRVNTIYDSGGAKLWQRNYHEHIIRNERELNAIRAYIQNNPTKWAADRDNARNTRQFPPPNTIDDYLRDMGLI